MNEYTDDEWADYCRHDDDRPAPRGRTWACSLCGSTHWPDPDSSCPLCRDSDDDQDDDEDEEDTE